MRTLYGYNTLTNRVDYSFATSDEVSFENFQALSENIICLVFESALADASTVYVKDGEIKTRLPENPNGAYVWDNFLENWVIDLPKIVREKEITLNKLCQNAIYLGYSSFALGQAHHYPANDKDQMNMIASVTDSYNPSNDANWRTLFWCKDSNDVWNYREHTAGQIQKAGSDGKAFITQTLSKNAMLQYELSQAQTVEQINAIVW